MPCCRANDSRPRNVALPSKQAPLARIIHNIVDVASSRIFGKSGKMPLLLLAFMNIPGQTENIMIRIALTHAAIALSLICTMTTRQSASGADWSLKDTVMEGKFGTALDATYLAADAVKPLAAYKTFPITVELWCRLDGSASFNILVANEPKESRDHWEIYSEAGAGTLSAFLPGMTPAIIKSPKVVTDGQWHYVAMVVDDKNAALYVDGNEVVKTPIAKNQGGTVVSGAISAGKALSADGVLECNGRIDDLRLSNTAREIHGVPDGPLKADAHTIGLWSFDYVEGAKEFADASSNANPMRVPNLRSLSDADRASYKAGPSPLTSKAVVVPLKEGNVETPPVAPLFSLDGQWQLIEGGTAATRLASDWVRPIPAVVPGSVHTALYQAGVIPFPYEGKNQDIVRPWSFKSYWYKKTFPRPPKGQDRTLVFEGVCNRCVIWLNGKELGRHEGMFDRIELPVHELLQDENILIVRLGGMASEEGKIPIDDYSHGLDGDWEQTVVFNNSYGWHYSKFPPLGIWRSVQIHGEPAVKVRDPFIATRDAKAGLMDLVATVAGPQKGWTGKLVGVIEPENFDGQPCHFEYPVNSADAEKEVHLQYSIPNPQLWWPVDMGKPNLYRLKLAFLPAGGGTPDVQQTTFGIRTVLMQPVNGRPHPKRFNWTFNINGKPMFIKGTGWCTCDAMMDFSRERYDRFLTMAVSQHIQMLRAWGSGMVETEDFYDLCDRKGIMVMQEWPTAWNSHEKQPFEMLEETVREGTLRLRNRPSLVIYTGGNESGKPFGKAIDMMGRLNIELDGTRDFHRGEPFGGSAHDYDVYWGGQHLDRAFTMQSIFYGEFGIASYPCYESVQRFLPDDEKNLWPAPPDKSFAYHTPIFNTSQDFERQTKMSQYFTAGKTMEQFIIGTQLAQAVGVRHALERARTRWPESTGALYYKLNDNCPAASWATVDWYGLPKISHYFMQDSFAPLVAVTLFPKATTHGETLTMPVFLLDDADALNGAAWEVVVRAYGADLKQIKESRFQGNGAVKSVARLGEFVLTAEQTKTAPLLVITDVIRNGTPTKRNYYFTNFEPVKDCLFNLPKTKLAIQAGDGKVVVRNDGPLPAVGVNISRPGHLDTFFVSDNYFWLDPGETTTVSVNTVEGIVVDAWNTETVNANLSEGKKSL
jgi:beta-mannosidase